MCSPQWQMVDPLLSSCALEGCTGAFCTALLLDS